MTVVIVCSVLLALGIAATVAWGSLPVDVPAKPETPRPADVIRRYLWFIGVLLWTTLATGVLVVGPAGRLAMRILAVTAGPAAQGRRTEADEIVGRISGDGTLGLFIFVGLVAGFVSVLTFLVLRRWLRAGRVGGLLLGLFLLVVFASRIDPLRSDNADFDLVGPGWLSIVIYSAMALLQGMAVVAIAGRVSRWLPLPEWRVGAVLPYLVLVLALPSVVVPIGVVLAGVLWCAASLSPLPQVASKRAVAVGGRAAVALGSAVALPGFVSAVVDIAGRGP